jgi:RNA polymerase sigma factor (sigma-70 family)
MSFASTFSRPRVVPAALVPADVLRDVGPRVWGLCRRLAPDPDDCYQEIWEKVFRALPGFDPTGAASVGTWVIRIAHRHLVDRHRRRLVRGDVLPAPDLPALEPGADERLQGARQEARLEAALLRLPEDQRRVVVLHHCEGLPLDEIAAAEGVPVGTLKSRLHRGRGRLAELLGGVL